MILRPTFAEKIDELITFGRDQGVSLDDMIDELSMTLDGLEIERIAVGETEGDAE